MLISYKRGQGSIVLRVKIRNSSVSTGAGLTGLTSASTGLIISTIADNEASATVYTVAGSTIESITTLGTYAAPTATKCRFKEVDSTNHKGVYEIQIADARFAVSNAKSLLVSVSGATNAAECDALIPLQDVDPYDSVRAGLTAIPNVASGSAGGLIIQGTGTTGLDVTSGKVDVGKVNAVSTSSVTAVAANIGHSQPLNFTGTAGSALVKSDIVDIAGSAVSTSTAQIGVNVVNFGGSAGTFASGIPSVNSSQFGGATVTATTSVTFPSACTVATTTGAVGSVTGNVGGNVVGSVGSISGVSFPSNFAALGINASGHVSRVTLVDTTTTNTDMLTAAGIRTAVGLASANLDTQLDALPTNAELATAITTGLTTALTEGYRGTGATGSVRDLLYEIIAHMGESSISSTTKTLKKIDGTTTAKTYTLNSATTPTSITETT